MRRYKKDEERFLSAQADHFAGAKWKEKASACFVRNDGWAGREKGGRWRRYSLLTDISSPSRGGWARRRFISLSKALKSARALRVAKNSAVCNAESFSATAVATNWLMLLPSSSLCSSTTFFSERGSAGDRLFSLSKPFEAFRTSIVLCAGWCASCN